MSRFCILVAISAAMIACGGSTPLQAAETGPVREYFVCNFTNGAGLPELMEATDYFVSQLDATPSLERLPTYLWTPVRANTSADFMWFASFPNLNAFGDQMDAYLETGVGPDVQSRFDAISSCESGMSTIQQIYDGDEAATTNETSALEAYACKLNPGKSMDDLNAAIGTWHDHVKALGTVEDADVYMEVPLLASTPYTHFIFGVHPTFRAMSSNLTDVLTSQGWDAVAAQLNDVQDCESGLWSGQQIIGPGG
ncbi:MAG: hypothetical protein EP301_13045 [Gammaproteobacteria bacterium]|nr:MAG: hypothetical protein EP301_13045 [Gammaproteobacteria bacterium]